MTRNFRDEWEAATRGGDEPLAPAADQDRIAALLRGAAAHDTASMPRDVDARIRAALTAELTAARAEAGADGADSPARADGGAREAASPASTTTRDADVVHAVGASPARTDAVPLPRPSAAPDGSPPRAADHATDSGPHPVTASDAARKPHDAPAPTGASIASLDAHRRRRAPRRAAMALAAAAAVAIGAAAVVKSGGTEPAPTAGSQPVASASPGAVDYASRVRVTQTQTKYTSAGLARQANALTTSTAPPVEPAQANAQSLGPLAAGRGVQTCLDAVAKGLVAAPDKVYADFATYDGTPAVIVVAVKGATRTAWVVSRTCSTATDLEAGPTTLHT